MDVFVARQPIFDPLQRVTGYELLFRNGPENFFPRVDGSYASSRVIHDSVHVFGLGALSASRRLYINVTRDILVAELIRLVPPEVAVVEILESIPPDPEVLAACRSLRASGYAIALDDFVFRPGYEPLVELADVVKVDFLATRGAERKAVVERFARPGVKFLAEKIESQGEFTEATKLGYTLFQGYFFCKPEMVTARDIPAYKVNYLRLLKVANEPVFDMNKVEEVLRHEPSASVKLLRYLNSAIFGLRHKVTSIRQALLLLGERPCRRWVSLLAVTGIGGDKPGEIVVMSLVRARFLELLSGLTDNKERGVELFLLGMLSLVDVMIGRPMDEVLGPLALSDDVRNALLEGRGAFAPWHRLAVAYERAEWTEVESLVTSLKLDASAVADAWRDSIAWANEIFSA